MMKKKRGEFAEKALVIQEASRTEARILLEAPWTLVCIIG